MTSLNCCICDEKVNKTNHALVSCMYCQFEACKVCCKTYIVDQFTPKCMNASCAKEWTRRFLNDNFPLTFLRKEWKESREKIAFDRQQALLPATQEILERRNRYNRAITEYRILTNQAKELSKYQFKFSQAKYKDDTITLDTYPDKDKVQKYLDIRKYIDNTLQPIINHRGNTSSSRRPVEKKFVRACPSEECRGFLGEDWKCGLCHLKTCSKCHVVKQNNSSHECNPDDVATATLLNKDTKPCPKCHTGIFKIDGCNQMWCTQCHTAFSWVTGEIETRIHNPHYYEWQRQNNGGVAPRVAGDVVPCQQDHRIAHDWFQEIQRHQRNIGAEMTALCMNIIRDTIHLREWDLLEYSTAESPKNLENRILYLEKKIDKPTFIRRIQKEAKKREISQEIRQVLEMYIQVVSEIMMHFRGLLGLGATKLHLEHKLAEVDNIRVYTNTVLKEIFDTFHYGVKEIRSMQDGTIHGGLQGVLITTYKK